MGQGQSCIQGTPDWLGPYEKPSGKSTTEEKDLYDRLSELILVSNITKDYTALEEFLSKSDKSHLSLRSPTSSTNKSRTSTMDANDSSSPKYPSTKLQLEKLFHKETNCKSVNFSQEPKDCKSSNLKPVVAKKRCTIHGKENRPQEGSTTQTQQRHHGCCREPQTSTTIADSQNSRPSHKNVQKSAHLTSTIKNSCKSSATIIPTKTNIQSATSDVSKSNHKSVSNQCALHPASAVLPEKMNAVMPSTEVRITQAIDTRKDDFQSEAEDSSYPEILKDLMSFPATEPESSDLLAALAVQSAKDTIQRLEDRAESIVETFAVVLKHLEHGDWSTFCISSSRLCDDIRKVLRDYNVTSDATDPEEIKIKNHVTSALNQLTGHLLQSNMAPTGDYTSNLLPSFRILGEVLHELVEFLIGKELTVLVESLQHQTSTYCVKEAICVLAEMSMSGDLMCKLITQVGGFKSILNLCEMDRCHNLIPLALRTLTILCGSPNSTSHLEMTSGLKFIIRTLENETELETVKCEAVGFLAQVVKRWSESGVSIEQQVKGHLNQLVKGLIEVAQKTHSSEAFLLSAATLSSLSSCSSEASQWLLDHKQEMRLLAEKSKQESYV